MEAEYLSGFAEIRSQEGESYGDQKKFRAT